MKKIVAIVVLTGLLIAGCQPEQSSEGSTKPVEPATVSETTVTRTPVLAKDIPIVWAGENPDDIVPTPGGGTYRANVHAVSANGTITENPWPSIESVEVALGSGSDTVNVSYRDYIETASGESRNNIINVRKESGIFDSELGLYSVDVPDGLELADAGRGVGLPGTLGAILVIEIAPDITPGEYPLEIGLEIDGKDYGTVPCIVNVVEPPTKETPEVNNNYHSDNNYLSVNLPDGWAAAEGPEWIAFTGHLQGLVAFNSWGEEGFWSPPEQDGTSSTYGPSTVMNSLPPGGAYIVLIQTVMPPTGFEPDEYLQNDLSGLLTPGDWRQGSGFNSFHLYKWGRSLGLQVACAPDASDATVAAINSLLVSWRFDPVPTGDAAWMGIQARKLLPEAVEPFKFSNRAGSSSSSRDGVSRITEVETGENMMIFRFIYQWDRSSHWWDIDVSPAGEAIMTGEGGDSLPFD